MWKWFIALILLVILLIPTPALAASSDDVTVTATGYVCDAPGGFTIIYISDYEVGISWTKGEDAVNTMVRAAIGRMPESRTDGYEVYYGEGTYATDWSNNLDTMDAKVYYRAWSENASGLWEEEGASGFIEGIGMILIAFALVIMILMVMGFVFKKGTIFLVAGFAAAGLGFILLGEDALSAKWMFGWASIVVSLVCFVEALLTWMALRPKPEMDEQEEYKRQVLAITRRKPKYPY